MDIKKNNFVINNHEESTSNLDKYQRKTHYLTAEKHSLNNTPLGGKSITKAEDATIVNRETVGGKGAALYRMQQAGMKVPEFTTIDVKSIENLENHSLDIAILKPFINDIASFNLVEVNIANIKQYIQNRYSNQPEQRNLYLQGLASFITSDSFYQQITNSQVAESIRENYNQLIASLPEDSAIIVRSSGIKEDNYGDAQAGKFESLVHGKQDIVLTCLQVLASGFQPHVCPFSAPQPMSLIIQRCIDCSFGGVAMSRTSLKDHRGKIEFVPGQPKGGVSGVAGVTPHTYLVTEENNKFLAEFTEGNVTSQFILKQQDNNNFEEKPVALTENSSVNLTEAQLKQIYQYIKQGEDMLLCPVDFEFAIAKDGTVYALQLRPLTVLTGGVNFTCPPPENPITTGTLISEGFCAGELFYVQSEQDADLVPQGAIVVANHGETWMVDNNQFFKKVGGFIFQQGGANDHIAITMRQQEKPYLVTTDNFDELKNSNAIVSLACGNFKENSGAYVTAGSEFADKLATMQSTVKATYKPRSSEAPVRKTPELYFDRPDIAFKNLHDLNYILLDYFSADSWLTRCFTEKGMLLLTMAPHRIEIIKEAIQEIGQLFADFNLFLQGYKQYLQLGINSEVYNTELQQKLAEVEKLTAEFNDIKTRVNYHLDNILQQFTNVANQTIPKGDFSQLLQNATKIVADTQKLNIPKAINEVSSLHDSILWIHQGFIKAIYTVAINSGLGLITRYGKIYSILFSDTEEQKTIENFCINSMYPLINHVSAVVIMDNAIIATAQLGVHACTIEMLEQAEADKGRTLRLRLSDNFKETKNFQGKLKRFWFCAQLLHCISFADNADEMKVSVEESTGIISIEVSHIETKKEMLEKFSQLIKVLNTLSNLDIDLNDVKINLEEGAKWNFSTLNQKIYNLTSEENQQEFAISVFLLGYKQSNISAFENIYFANYTPCFEQGKNLNNSLSIYYKNLTDKEVELILSYIDIKDEEKLLYILLINNVIPFIDFIINKYSYWFTSKENLLEMLADNGELIVYFGDKLYSDAEIMLAGCSSYGLALKYASYELKNNKYIVLTAVKNNGKALKYASNKLKNDEEVVFAAIENNYEALRYVNITSLIKPAKLKYPSWFTDKKHVLKIVAHNDLLLEYIDPKFLDDEDVLLTAIKYNTRALKYVKTRLIYSKEFLLKLIAVLPERHKKSLENIDLNIANSKEIIIAIANNHFSMFKCFNIEVRGDIEIAHEAIKKNPFNLSHVSDKLKNNKPTVLLAVRADNSTFKYASDELKNDANFILENMDIGIFLIQNASDELKNNKQFMLKAIKINRNSYMFAHKTFRDDQEILRAYIGS